MLEEWEVSGYQFQSLNAATATSSNASIVFIYVFIHSFIQLYLCIHALKAFTRSYMNTHISKLHKGV